MPRRRFSLVSLPLAATFAATLVGCASAPNGSSATSPEARCRSYALSNPPDVQPAQRLSGDQPSMADFAGQTGSVCVRVTITPSGSVIDPAVVQTDNDAFAKAFVHALNGWRYEPATRGSAKVPYHTAIFARLPG
jgi:TonB family protein